MFCFQCQETAHGTGCTVQGVCGKKARTSAYMDVLIAIVRSVGVVAELTETYGDVEQDGRKHGNVGEFIVDALFSTITNANFDDDSLRERIMRGVVLRDALVEVAKRKELIVPDYVEFELPCGDEDCKLGDNGEQDDACGDERLRRTDDEPRVLHAVC